MRQTQTITIATCDHVRGRTVGTIHDNQANGVVEWHGHCPGIKTSPPTFYGRLICEGCLLKARLA